MIRRSNNSLRINVMIVFPERADDYQADIERVLPEMWRQGGLCLPAPRPVECGVMAIAPEKLVDTARAAQALSDLQFWGIVSPLHDPSYLGPLMIRLSDQVGYDQIAIVSADPLAIRWARNLGSPVIITPQAQQHIPTLIRALLRLIGEHMKTPTVANWLVGDPCALM